MITTPFLETSSLHMTMEMAVGLKPKSTDNQPSDACDVGLNNIKTWPSEK